MARLLVLTILLSLFVGGCGVDNVTTFDGLKNGIDGMSNGESEVFQLTVDEMGFT